jgi:hypothetical protein
MHELLEGRQWIRGFQLAASIDPEKILEGFVEVISERPVREITLPGYLQQEEEIWIPMVQGAKVSGADALKREGDWVRIRPKGPTFSIHNPESFSGAEAE